VPPAPAPGGVASLGSAAAAGLGMSLFGVLCALIVLAWPALVRRLRLAAALSGPVPFLSVCEQPG
jgi:hypothetical protein